MNREDSNRQIRLGAILSYVSMFSGYAIQLVYTPWMIRIIGQNQYGLYNLTNSIVSYLSLFSLGFGSAYIRFYMRHKTEEDNEGIAKLNGMFMVVFLSLGALATICGVFLVMQTKALLGPKFSASELELAKKLMMLMVLNIAISFPLIPFVSYIQANERFIFQNGLNILKQALGPFLGIPLLLSGYGSVGVVLTTTLVSIIISFWQLYYSFKKIHIKFSFHGIDFGEMKEVAVFSSFIFLNLITDQINWNVDKFILGRYFGAVPVAVYGIAAQLNSYYVSLSTAISTVFIPRINAIVAKNGQKMNHDLTNLFIKIGRIQFMVVGLVLLELFFIGRPFIGFWAGPDYYPAYPILMIMLVPVTVPLIQNAGIAIQQAKNLHVFRSVVYLGIALGNIGLSMILAKYYGGVGTAMATSIAIIIGNIILMNIYYQKKIKLDIFKFWKHIAKFTPTWVVTVIAGIVITHFISPYTIVGMLVTAVVVGIAYVLMLVLTVFDSSERQMIKAKLRLG